MRLVKETKPSKFDETVEVHIRTGLNVRHADEQLRGTIALPHGLGKEVKIAVFAKGDKAREAEEAGADFVGADDLAKRIQDEGFTDFDVAIATPDMMPVVGRLGRILGPQGKMPNPKVGTVTMDVKKAVEESKAGKVEYRTDRTAIVHMILGKTSFEEPPAARELPGHRRGAHPRQAERGQGQVPQDDRARLHHGPRHQGGPVQDPRSDRGSCRSRSCVSQIPRRPPASVSPG